MSAKPAGDGDRVLHFDLAAETDAVASSAAVLAEQHEYSGVVRTPTSSQLPQLALNFGPAVVIFIVYAWQARMLSSVLFTLAGLTVTLIAAVYWCQDALLYFPQVCWTCHVVSFSFVFFSFCCVFSLCAYAAMNCHARASRSPRARALTCPGRRRWGYPTTMCF